MQAILEPMAHHQISARKLALVLLSTIAALVYRAWLQLELRSRGVDSSVAADASYLIVPLMLALLLIPLWRTDGPFVARQFLPLRAARDCMLMAIGIGLTLRLLWWSQLIAGVSLGIYSSSDVDVVVGPTISFQCSQPEIVMLGVLAIALLAPIVEELVHRVYVISFLRSRGMLVAISLSAVCFMALHKTASWPFALIAGIVFGLLYWWTQSIWPSLVAHAVFNSLTLLDWRCLSVQWNPTADVVPVVLPAATALVTMLLSSILLGVLLHRTAIRARARPDDVDC